MTRRVAIAAFATVLASSACKGPVGPVVHVIVRLDKDPVVLSEIHGLSVVVRVGDESETLDFPKDGPTPTPLAFPASFALIASDAEGTMTVEVTALARESDAKSKPVGFGFSRVRLNEKTLYDVDVEVGVASRCGQEDAPATDVPDICFRRDDIELTLAGGDPKKGNINNGVEMIDLDGDRKLDLLAVWSDDRNDKTTTSGLSVFYGSEIAERGLVWNSDDEEVYDDIGDPGTQRSNTEGAVLPFIAPEEDGVRGASDDSADLVTASFGAKGLTIRARLGRRFYEPPVFMDLGSSPGLLRAADVLPAEGKELVVALRKEARLIVVLPAGEDGMPSVADVALEGLRTGEGLRGFDVVDLDGVNGLDIVAAGKGEPDGAKPGQITTHLNQGDGSFAAAPVGDPEFGWREVRGGDLDGDGAVDLAAVNVDRGVVGVFRGTGDGTFAPAFEYTLTGPDGIQQTPDRVRLADMDGDGITDIVACGVSKTGVHILLLGAAGVPRFPVIRLPAGEEDGEPAEDMQGCALGDSDKDGVIDRLAVTDRTRNRLRVFVSP